MENVNNPAKKRRLSLEDKLRHEREKHPLKEPCTDCPRNCQAQINQMRRIQIYLQYWNKSYNDRKSFLHMMVHRHDANTKRFSSRQRAVSIILAGTAINKITLITPSWLSKLYDN